MNISKIIEANQELKDCLDVYVKIDWRQQLNIVINDLIKKRNCNTNKVKDSFDEVLKYYLGEEDFKKYVIEGKTLKN